jgi:hypothetical protein
VFAACVRANIGMGVGWVGDTGVFSDMDALLGDRVATDDELETHWRQVCANGSICSHAVRAWRRRRAVAIGTEKREQHKLSIAALRDQNESGEFL